MNTLIKVLIFILLFAILFNLFRAMQHMLKTTKHRQEQKRPTMSNFIGQRLIWTVTLILLLILSLLFGFIEPNPRPY